MDTSPGDSFPRISIVTPSLNQGEFLEECILSVISQNYPNYEHIVIDGGSSDNSVEIIKKYEKYLSCWVSEPDKGQSDGINKGLKMADGALVAWLNADDYFLDGAFTKIVDAYNVNSNASFYYANGLRVDREGNSRGEFYPKGTVIFDMEAFILGLNYIMQPSVFINSRVLKEIDYLAINLHYGMDTDLWIRLAKKASPQPVLGCISASREYGLTKTSQGAFKRAEELRTIAENYCKYPLTPGGLLYYLDTLHSYVKGGDSPFPIEFAKYVVRLSQATAQVLVQSGLSGEDGMPVKTLERDNDGIQTSLVNINEVWQFSSVEEARIHHMEQKIAALTAENIDLKNRQK